MNSVFVLPLEYTVCIYYCSSVKQRGKYFLTHTHLLWFSGNSLFEYSKLFVSKQSFFPKGGQGLQFLVITIYFT